MYTRLLIGHSGLKPGWGTLARHCIPWWNELASNLCGSRIYIHVSHFLRWKLELIVSCPGLVSQLGLKADFTCYVNVVP